MPFEHLKPFWEWKKPESSWQVPFLAAISVGIPVVAGWLLQQPRMGLLAATGAMVILYLPRTAMPVAGKIRRLAACCIGFTVCQAIGSASTFHPAASVLTLGFLTVSATAICRANAVPPPGSFFFVLIASIACCGPFEPATIPLRAGMVALGGAISCGAALAHCLLVRQPVSADSGKKVTRHAAIVVESCVIGISVALSLLAARLLKLDNPYWAPTSAAAILQGATFRAVWHRKVHRIAGTAVGMMLSWLLLPAHPAPAAMAATIVFLVFVVEYLVPRHYGVAVIFITPLTVTFAEYSLGGIPLHGLLTTRLLDIVLGSVIGAIGGSVLHLRSGAAVPRNGSGGGFPALDDFPDPSSRVTARLRLDRERVFPTMKPVVSPADSPATMNILGISMILRIHGRDTNGTLSAVESLDVPGGGPPPHIHHNEDETFQIVQGEYEWTVGGETFTAGAGTTIFAPRGIPHTYRCLEPGRLLCFITPAGFEGFFEEIAAMGPEEQQDIPRVVEIGGKYGMEIVPPSA